MRVTEGVASATFIPQGRMRVKLRGPVEKVVETPAGKSWQVRVTQSRPATLSHRLQLAEFVFADKAGLARELKLWEGRGVPVRPQILGSLYGISGKVIDNRRYIVVLNEVLTPQSSIERRAALMKEHGAAAIPFEEVKTPPSAILELLDETGAPVALGEDWISAETLDGAGFLVRRVEFGMGYDWHNVEDRLYRGTLAFTADRNGQLAVINQVPLEDHLRGLVPSEIFARAHPEALKAQAVTARGEVLAKVGLKHLADPYLLCAEQHCAVYRGRTGEVVSTNLAVAETEGEGLFSSEGRLVDSVYSAVCGGHTEDNESVWGGVPNPHLRAKPDLLVPPKGAPKPKGLRAYLETDFSTACKASTLSQPSKYRWERTFPAQELDALAAPLGVGRVQALKVESRGRSGRARVLTVSGDQGATQVRGELNIRKLFKMLNSAMFVVEPKRDAAGVVTEWAFHGGGWGHGVGMCQTGAIGRAEAGHSYRDILRFYFSGAEVAPIYPPRDGEVSVPPAPSASGPPGPLGESHEFAK